MHELLQINDIFGRLRAPRRDDTRLKMTVEKGDGASFAFASVIDGITGDAI